MISTGSITEARVVLVPGVLALLPEYASLTDPVAELRAACLAAVAWLVEEGGPVTVVADAQGRRVSESWASVSGVWTWRRPSPGQSSMRPKP